VNYIRFRDLSIVQHSIYQLIVPFGSRASAQWYDYTMPTILSTPSLHYRLYSVYTYTRSSCTTY
jgi:hypothetical protein